MDTNAPIPPLPLRAAVRRGLRLVALLLLAALALGAPAGATVITVNSLDDEPATANGNCTLREAFIAARQNVLTDLCAAGQAAAADVILLPAGTVVWNGPHQIEDGGGGAVTLRGPVATSPTAQVEIDATHKGRFLRLLSGAHVTIENVEIRHGDVSADPSGDRFGGAILALGVSNVDLTLRNVRLDGNIAGFGGALFFETSDTCASCNLRIERSVIATNLAAVDDLGAEPRGGGAFLQIRGATTVRIVDSRFQVNRTSTSFADNTAAGGGLWAEIDDTASMKLNRVTFAGNSVAADAGGPEAGGASITAAGQSALEIVDTTFEQNSLEEPEAAGGFYRSTALYLETNDSATLFVDRTKMVANDTAEIAVDFRFKHFSTAAAMLRNVLVAAGAGRGAHVENHSGALLLGHWTVADHLVEELRLDRGTAELRLENSILDGNTHLVQSGNPTIDTTNIVGFDPSFVDRAAGDYRLSSSSNSIDFGNAEHASVGRFDTGHGARVIGVDTDAGAFEYGAVFSDDFEVGSTGAWSARQP